MIGISRQIVRVALLVLLFQFVGPAFLPVITQEISVSKETTISVQHTSIVVPMFLKENDEKESAAFSSESAATPLLDLSSHSFNLTAVHDNKHAEVYEAHGVLHPPLITLFCTLLI
jgi:hypothetical protein